jgi:hypothetical protein
MPARGNLGYNDAAATPVLHTFKPSQSKGDVLVWRDSTQSIYAGQFVLTCMQRVADRKTKTTKVTWKLETPVLEQTSPSTSSGIQPAPTVAYTPLATIEWVLPDRMTLQERKDLLALFRGLVSSSTTTDQVQNLDMYY